MDKGMEIAQVVQLPRSAIAVVLNAAGEPTGEEIRISVTREYTGSRQPWSPWVQFGHPTHTLRLPRADEKIVFVRDPEDPGTCAKWIYLEPPSNPDDARPYRLVRKAGGEIGEVLWQMTWPADVLPWNQVCQMAGQWPRLEDGSDELSRTYALGRMDAIISDGLIFQLFVIRWSQCAIDIRPPFGYKSNDI